MPYIPSKKSYTRKEKKIPRKQGLMFVILDIISLMNKRGSIKLSIMLKS
uniref:Uncharacterized protein n=1 Tax=Rhizophora mucronata TaxID=61149 RepID=A0A2P2QWQ0_RHIMU